MLFTVANLNISDLLFLRTRIIENFYYILSYQMLIKESVEEIYFSLLIKGV